MLRLDLVRNDELVRPSPAFRVGGIILLFLVLVPPILFRDASALDLDLHGRYRPVALPTSWVD